MALVKRSGSLNHVSLQGSSGFETTKILPADILNATDKDVTHLRHIKDTFTTKTAMNPNIYQEEFRMLAAYPSSSKVRVTYFYQNKSEIDTRTTIADLSGMEDIVHSDLIEIRELELSLTSPIEQELNDEDNSVTLSLEGVFYPGFIPHIGDIFFFDVGNSKVAIFTINNVTPTTYRQGSYHRFNANSNVFLTDEIYDDLVSRTNGQILYFDKRKYLEDGELSLLNSTSFYNLKDLTYLRKELIHYYMNKYYSEVHNSVMRYDNVYDPYLVQYLKKKLSLRDYPRRPEQLLTSLIDYHKSFWWLLTDSVDKSNFSDISTVSSTKYYNAQALHPDTNAIINRNYIVLSDTSTSNSSNTYSLRNRTSSTSNTSYASNRRWIDCPLCTDSESSVSPNYIFGSSFFDGDFSSMTDEESLIYKYMKGMEFDINSAIKLLQSFRNLSEENQFYFIPIYIDIVDDLIVKIK